MKRCMTDKEINQMVENLEKAFDEYFEREGETLLYKMVEELKKRINTSMSLDLEYQMDGYTKSLITNFQNMFPMNVSDFSECEITWATENALIRKVNHYKSDTYMNEKVKLTKKGKAWMLKKIA